MFDKYKAKLAEGSLIEYEKQFAENYIKVFKEYQSMITSDEKYIMELQRKARIYKTAHLMKDGPKRKLLLQYLENYKEQINNVINEIQSDSIGRHYYENMRIQLDKILIEHSTWCRQLSLIVPNNNQHLTYRQYEENSMKLQGRVVEIDTVLGTNIYHK